MYEQAVRYSELNEAKRQGKSQGRTEERRKVLLELLDMKGEISKDIKEKIEKEQRLENLEKWFEIAVNAGSNLEFEDSIK